MEEHQLSDRPRQQHGGKNQEVSGVRLWRATAEWLVAQGGDETRWGDILEPQQLTQLLWSLGKCFLTVCLLLLLLSLLLFVPASSR